MKSLLWCLLFALLPTLTKGQSGDTLKTRISEDKLFGYFRSSSFVGMNNSYNSQKILIGEKLETSFDLKNPHLGVGGKFLFYRKISEQDIAIKRFDVCMGTLSYSPFLHKNFKIIGGGGFTSRNEFASTFSVRYMIDSLFPKGSATIETNLTTIGDEIDFDVLAFIARNQYFVGGYYANNGVSGIAFGAYEHWMMLRFVFSNQSVENKNIVSGSFQLDLTFPFVRKNPKLVYYK